MTSSLTRSPVTAAALVALACAPDASPSDGGLDARRIPDAPPYDAWVPPVPTATIEAGNAVAEGDPFFEGQQRFLYDAWGTERLDEWPPADFMLGLMTEEPAVFGNQYESFGFVPNPGDDFPWGFTRGLEDPTRVHQTCAMCHVGRLPDGTLWLGLPNGELDIMRFQYEVNARWVAAGNPPLLDELSLSKALDYGPGRFAAETDSYPVAVSADFPPYFFLGDRTAMNYLGTGGNVRTEVFLATFAFGAGNPNDEDAIVPFPSPSRIDPFIEFMGWMTPPPAPVGDAAMIAAGAAIYARERCGDCHHLDDPSMNGITTYDRAPGAIERLPGDDPEFPRGVILTDYLHRILIDGDPVEDRDGGMPEDGSVPSDAGPSEDTGPTIDPGRDIYIEFILANHLAVRASDGYRVPDLHGLWATAPYLHNGSVPTLDDLLRPAAERTATFSRGDFLVDTAQPGNSNAGHEFGSTISDSDRAALVAYLLSL